MTIDRERLRRKLVVGWPDRMCVMIEVGTVSELLSELERLEEERAFAQERVDRRENWLAAARAETTLIRARAGLWKRLAGLMRRRERHARLVALERDRELRAWLASARLSDEDRVALVRLLDRT